MEVRNRANQRTAATDFIEQVKWMILIFLYRFVGVDKKVCFAYVYFNKISYLRV